MNYNEQEIREHYRRLTKLLIDRKYTITTMESATSGIQQRGQNTAGSPCGDHRKVYSLFPGDCGGDGGSLHEDL